MTFQECLEKAVAEKETELRDKAAQLARKWTGEANFLANSPEDTQERNALRACAAELTEAFNLPNP